jgi:hypothetical protein
MGKSCDQPESCRPGRVIPPNPCIVLPRGSIGPVCRRLHNCYLQFSKTLRARKALLSENSRSSEFGLASQPHDPPRSIPVTEEHSVETPASQEVAGSTPISCNVYVTIDASKPTQMTRDITSDFFHRISSDFSFRTRNTSKITTYADSSGNHPLPPLKVHSYDHLMRTAWQDHERSGIACTPVRDLTFKFFCTLILRTNHESFSRPL